MSVTFNPYVSIQTLFRLFVFADDLHFRPNMVSSGSIPLKPAVSQGLLLEDTAQSVVIVWHAPYIRYYYYWVQQRKKQLKPAEKIMENYEYARLALVNPQNRNNDVETR